MKNDISRGEIVIYKVRDNRIKLEVKLKKDTVWLSQKQIAELFSTERSVITKHLRNIFKDKELEQNLVCANFAHTAIDGKTYQVKLYNLDAIISVGYRVNSRRATQFRIWATRVLKDYLVKGYALNQKRLVSEQAKKLEELKLTISFIKSKAVHPELTGQAQELLNIVDEYANALTLLYEYDNKTLAINKKKKPSFALTYEHADRLVAEVKIKLYQRGESSELFGQQVGHKFRSIIGSLCQTFDKKELYPSVEEKAAHLFYFTIKDHPFADGNKRIASLLFIYFLEQNNYLLKRTGERKINDNTLVALSLLIAASQPKEKDVMIKLITNLLKE